MLINVKIQEKRREKAFMEEVKTFQPKATQHQPTQLQHYPGQVHSK